MLGKVDRIVVVIVVVVVVFVVMIDGKLASQRAKTDPRLAGGHEADKLDLVITIINLMTNLMYFRHTFCLSLKFLDRIWLMFTRVYAARRVG